MATVGCCDNRPGGRLFGKEEKYPGAARKGACGEAVGYWAACLLLFARVLHGYVFAWLLFLTSCMIIFGRSCVRMVIVFDELHDYVRKELCSHGYFI